MSANSPIWAPDANAERERESRIRLALLRGALENLATNRRIAPLLALAVAVMFSQWVSPLRLAAWVGLVVAGVALQLLVIKSFPKGELSPATARRWTITASAANFISILCWTALGWFLWAPGNEVDHTLITIVLAATLAAHATIAGASLELSVPAFVAYALAMALIPLQEKGGESLYLAIVTPFYVWYIARIARQNHTRARSSIILVEERNSLLAELVMAKIDSDRGREKAEAASLAKSQFLANMSHELRTPLNAILGFSEVISSRMFANDVERNAEYAQMINSSGRHLLALINDILDLAKIEAGSWKLEEGEQDLRNIAEDALQLVQWRAKEGGATLENAIDEHLPLVWGDERALKQVLLNLLSNAVKFTPDHGRVTAFAWADDDGGLVFGVRDTGIGIAPEDQQRVFDSFGQGKHDVAIADKGTGLGLAIVKGLIESHGGRIALESEVGKGTTVTVSLPAARVRPKLKQLPYESEPAHFVA